MSNKIILLLTIVFSIVYSSVGIASDLAYKPGELIVRFAPKPDSKQWTKTEQNAILASINSGTIKSSCRLVPGLTLVKLPETLSVESALVVFKNASGILYAEPNYKGKALSTFPNDTRFNELWGMHNTGQTGGTENADIDAPEAWDIATGTDIIVAVIDSGVDYTHPDLTGNMWINPGEIPGDGIDDDGNGYVDDVYGWDFVCKYVLNCYNSYNERGTGQSVILIEKGFRNENDEDNGDNYGGVGSELCRDGQRRYC